MLAIQRIEATGLTSPRIAEAIHVTTHALRYYKTMQRFPNKHAYTALVRLAESRGVVLLASDFITDGSFVSSTETD
jgi:hypothetical protein